MSLTFFQKAKDYFNIFMDRDATNRNTLEYSKLISPIINEICSPLFKFGITMFTYSRIFNGGKRIYVCSNPDWVEWYITHNYQDEIDHLAHYVPDREMQYAFWDGFKMDKVFNASYQDFDQWNGFSIYEHNDDYIDYYDFAAHKDNNQIRNIYINNLNLLKRFIEYFKEKSLLMNSFQDKNNIIIPKKWNSFNAVRKDSNIILEPLPVDVSDFSSNTGKEIQLRNEAANLTRREIGCLKLLSEGKNVKQIAKEMSLSPKTVETCVGMSKMKTNSYS